MTADCKALGAVKGLNAHQHAQIAPDPMLLQDLVEEVMQKSPIYRGRFPLPGRFLRRSIPPGGGLFVLRRSTRT
jgi:hypothetical protein